MSIAGFIRVIGVGTLAVIFSSTSPGCTAGNPPRSFAEKTPEKKTESSSEQANSKQTGASTAETGSSGSSQEPVVEPTVQLPAQQTRSSSPADSRAYTLDAMVGQVNGQAIYAQTVFDPIAEQLSILGTSKPRAEFRQTADQLIAGRVNQLVLDSLILGEAERDLSPQEQAGLQQVLKKRLEELVRYWGLGSSAVADDELLEKTGKSLEETLDDARQQMIVQRYLRQKLVPKINVSRKDIERYYFDHYDQFNTAGSRTLRLCMVDSPAAAAKVKSMLQQGVPFEKVASIPENRYRSSEGGLMSQKAVGQEVFSQPQLNQAMVGLQAGQHSGPVQIDQTYWWVYVQAVEEGRAQPLRDVQLEIEEALRRQQFQTLTQQYRQKLFETGSYNPIEGMNQTLVEIAMNRFSAVP